MRMLLGESTPVNWHCDAGVRRRSSRRGLSLLDGREACRADSPPSLTMTYAHANPAFIDRIRDYHPPRTSRPRRPNRRRNPRIRHAPRSVPLTPSQADMLTLSSWNSILVLRDVCRCLCDLHDRQSRPEIREQEPDGLPVDLFPCRECFGHGDQGACCVLFDVERVLMK
jgi:hypothetical protein